MPHPKIHRQRIVLVAGIILVVVTLLAAVSIFVVMQRHAERLLINSLQSSLQSRVQQTEAEIRTGFGRTTVASTRPQLIDQVQRVNTGADDGNSRVILNKAAASFLSTGLTAIAVFDKDGRELARAGTFIQKSALSVPLNLPGRVQLMWDGQLMLHTAVEMNQAGKLVGKVVTETSLPATTGAFKDASRLGETGDMGLCAPFGANMQCFPTTLITKVFTSPRVAADGDLLPMAHALDGQTGFVSTQDYRRKEVEAAYAPVGDLGLGMVLKIDRADLYASVWWQLRYLIPLLLGVLLIALLSLRWLLAPLVLRLVRSEAQAREMGASLRNSEEHFRQLFETSLESILETRPDGQVLNANPAACALFGMGAQEMKKRGRGGLVDTSDPRLPILLAERARNGQVSGELRMIHRDGGMFECELSSSMYLDLNNQTCTNIVLRDITQRKRDEARITHLNAELEQRVGERTAQLESSNRDLQQFAHSVAHDLRQPIIAIGGFSGLLERSVADGRALHYLNRIKASARQAGELTDALLALANLSRVELRLQEVNLSALVHSVMDKLQQRDAARVTSIHIQEGLQAMADPMLIRLVLEELLGNAWKFSANKAKTEISFGLRATDQQAADGSAVYVVRDNGEGFDMAHADKLFRSFQRLYSPQDFPGVGIGLANIQRIVARHGGKIWAESALGEGASFFFTFGNARP